MWRVVFFRGNYEFIKIVKFFLVFLDLYLVLFYFIYGNMVEGEMMLVFLGFYGWEGGLDF